jgi:hypothetical protein
MKRVSSRSQNHDTEKMQLKVEKKDEAQAFAFLSPAWRGKVARQGQERASFNSARSATN